MQTVSFAGSSYNIPNVRGDRPWSGLSDFVIAAASKAINTAGGNFTLLADINFGATFGLVSTYYKSRTANVASAGQLRLANADTIKFRNTLNDGDLSVAIATNRLTFEGSRLVIAGAAEIVNADVSASAAIAYSKLNLATSIVNADINAAAAIAYSKLNLSTSIVNADVAAAAAIATTKLAALSNSIVPVTSASGFLTSSAVTATELGYVSGVSSAIQTQLGTKATDSLVVHLAGAETITGAKTFQDQMLKLQETGSTDVVTINVAALSASRAYTVPDAGGAASFVMTAGTQTISGTKTFDGQLIGKGTATNDSAAAGYIGELISASATGVGSLTTATMKNITSVTLTAGDWDLSANFSVQASGSGSSFTGNTANELAISTTTASTAGTTVGYDRLPWVWNATFAPTALFVYSCGISPVRVSITGSTTYYLNASVTFTSNSPFLNGSMSARRVR